MRIRYHAHRREVIRVILVEFGANGRVDVEIVPSKPRKVGKEAEMKEGCWRCTFCGLVHRGKPDPNSKHQPLK